MKTCLVGLHASGKTTALAALWFSVNDRSHLCSWYLHPSDRPEDAGKWSSLRDTWLSGRPLLRTKHKSSPDAMQLRLTNRNTQEKVSITVPDIAGEDFEKIFEVGRFPSKHASYLQNADHLVFFIHVGEESHPVLLRSGCGTVADGETAASSVVNDVRATDASLVSDNDREAGEVDSGGDDGFEWKPKKMHTGSKVISVLDGVRKLRNGSMPKITLALTAWDLMSADSKPNEVLLQKFPLLAQYLTNNFDFSVLGLSAQGCDYEDGDSASTVEFDEIERIMVIDDGLHHDITRIFA